MKIPCFGVGTWLLNGDDCISIVKHALSRGVRLIDTAYMYENEIEVGKAIAESSIPREDIFLVSKLNIEKHSYDGVITEIESALKRLQTSYVDLFLIHTPRGGNIIDTWKGMLKIKELGLAKEVGVSNFGPQHVDAIIQAGLEKPAYNEFEVNVFNTKSNYVHHFESQGIRVIGYCPLARGKFFGHSEPVAKIASETSDSEPIIALKWSLQSGLVTIPKTSNIARLNEMIDKLFLNEDGVTLRDFWLSETQMKTLEDANLNENASSAVTAMEDAFVC